MPTVTNAVGAMERLAAAYRQLGAARPACHHAARPVQAWLPTSERSGLPISVLGAVISCRRRYRDVDALLMDDDIQFLDNKPRRSPPRRSWARQPPTSVFSSRTCAGPPALGCWSPPGTSPSGSRPERADPADQWLCTQFVDNIVLDMGTSPVARKWPLICGILPRIHRTHDYDCSLNKSRRHRPPRPRRWLAAVRDRHTPPDQGRLPR